MQAKQKKEYVDTEASIIINSIKRLSRNNTRIQTPLQQLMRPDKSCSAVELLISSRCYVNVMSPLVMQGVRWCIRALASHSKREQQLVSS